jgi:hypothetical protein
LAFGLSGLEILAGATLEELAATLGDGDALPELESVVVRDDDLGVLDIRD